jgi:hypothetical protein
MNAAEQSTVATTAKRPNATASDIPAIARSNATCAPWNTSPNAMWSSIPSLRLALACGGGGERSSWGVVSAPRSSLRLFHRGTRDGARWGRTRSGAGRHAAWQGGGETTTWTRAIRDERAAVSLEIEKPVRTCFSGFFRTGRSNLKFLNF